MMLLRIIEKSDIIKDIASACHVFHKFFVYLDLKEISILYGRQIILSGECFSTGLFRKKTVRK